MAENAMEAANKRDNDERVGMSTTSAYNRTVQKLFAKTTRTELQMYMLRVEYKWNKKTI